SALRRVYLSRPGDRGVRPRDRAAGAVGGLGVVRRTTRTSAPRSVGPSSRSSTAVTRIDSLNPAGTGRGGGRGRAGRRRPGRSPSIRGRRRPRGGDRCRRRGGGG